MPNWTRWIPLLIVGLLTACLGGQNRAEAANHRFEAIPQLSGAVLITSTNGIDGGASGTCYGGYVDALYGTNKLQASEAIAFYRQYAQNDKWVINEKSSTGLSLFASDHDGYSLVVMIMTPAGPTELYYPLSIPPKVINEALSKFQTVYFIEVNYYPNAKNC